jgi:hypothetical protein
VVVEVVMQQMPLEEMAVVRQVQLLQQMEVMLQLILAVVVVVVEQ